MDIGARLLHLLDECGITQKELAETLNISASTVNGYIKNRRQPDAKTIIRLASYFNTTIDYIFGITSAKEPMASPYTANERHLLNIYRRMSEDQKPLFLATGRVFSDFNPKKIKNHMAD